MMKYIYFCRDCDFIGCDEITEEVQYCPKCNAELIRSDITKDEWDQKSINNKNEIRQNLNNNFVVDSNVKLVDSALWCLAVVPILFDIVASKMYLFKSDWIVLICSIVLNTLFAYIDEKRVRNSRYNRSVGYFFALFLVPVYLFRRAAITNKNYLPAITWCALFIISFIV